MSETRSDKGPRQGAMIGGWLCFLLGGGLMYLSLWTFWFYVPLLLVAFVLSIVAMSQRRIVGGIILLFATLAVPPVEWLVLAAIRTDDFARSHFSGPQLAEYEAGRDIGRRLVAADSPPVAEAAPEPERPVSASPAPAPQAVPETVRSDPEPERSAPGVVSPKPAAPETDVEAFDRRLARAIQTGADGGRVVELTGETAPIIFAIHAQRSIPLEKMAEYMLGLHWDQMDEFARHDFVEHLKATVRGWRAREGEGARYRVTKRMEVGEYDFERHAFPIKLDAELSEVLEPQPHLVARYKFARVPRGNVGGEVGLAEVYRIAFAPGSVEAIPVPMEQAPAIKAARREVDVSITGTIERCVEDKGSLLIYLAASEMTLTIPQSGESVTSQLPAPEAARPQTKQVFPPGVRPERAPGPPAERNESVASLTPEQAPQPPAAAAEAPVTLSPETVVTNVYDPDLRVTARNFQARYAGKLVRFTETVARKNPRERLLVFKGGGFLTSAYDVQVSLAEEQSAEFERVAIGTRLSIVGTLDRIVPPPFGVGSFSIRINDAQIPGAKRPSGPAAAHDHPPGAYRVTNVPQGDTLNVRSAPAMNSKPAFTLTNDEVVQVRGASVMNGDTEWFPVSLGEQDGWVSAKFLKRAEE